MGIVEIETEGSITPEKARQWKAISNLGAKLTIVVPEKSKKSLMDILWSEGISQSVAIGSYDLKISMP